MQDVAPFASALPASIQIILGLATAFLIGGAAGYMLRLWQEPRFRTDPTDRSSRPRRPEARTSATRETTAPTKPTPTPERAEGKKSSRKAPEVATVLVADDRMELVALHGAYLERHGYRVLTATDGNAALALARSEHPSVIVLDHTMPGRSGIEVTRELKADPATADIPVLLMTAHSYGAIGASARAAGCVAFMPKPCDPSRVLREIAAYAPAPRSRA